MIHICFRKNWLLAESWTSKASTCSCQTLSTKGIIIQRKY